MCDRRHFCCYKNTAVATFELQLLDNIHPDFCSYGLSAVDVFGDIFIGRHGGIAVLYLKSLADMVKIIDSYMIPVILESSLMVPGLLGCTSALSLGPLFFLNL